MDFRVEPMKADDWPAVRQIYADGIATGDATFETTVPDWSQWDASHLPACRLVARSLNKILGWAALSPVSRRRVYSGVLEVSVYVATSARGSGVGKHLLRALIEQSEQAGIWTLQASIFPENDVSISLHNALGFREVGRRERIGLLHGRWRDTVLLERRSRITGSE
jgi:L-amino acid N-acyltransferase YncA